MQVIINQLKVRRDELLFDFGVCMAGAVLGVIGCLFGEYMGGEGESLWGSGIITLLAFLCGILALSFTGIASVSFHFNLLVGMSCTRRDFLKGFIVVMLARFIILFGCSGIVYLIEGKIGTASGIDMSILFSPLMIFLIAAGTTIILFAGACILKFGSKMIWVFWAIWMAACIVPSRVATEFHKHTGSTFDKLGQIVVKIAAAFTPVTATALGIVMVIILGIVSARMLLKQKVQY